MSFQNQKIYGNLDMSVARDTHERIRLKAIEERKEEERLKKVLQV